MKKGNLKNESIKIFKSIVKFLEEGTTDYDTEDLKYLLNEARMYYDLYLFKANNQRLKAHQLEQMIVPKYEEGLRVKLREYLDEM